MYRTAEVVAGRVRSGGPGAVGNARVRAGTITRIKAEAGVVVSLVGVGVGLLDKGGVQSLPRT